MICLIHMRSEVYTLKNVYLNNQKIKYMKKNSKNNLSNTIKPFFDLKFFFLIITIILFGLLILTTASIDFASKNYNHPFYFTFKQLGHLAFGIFICYFFLYLSSANLKKYNKIFFLFFLFLLILVIIPGVGKTVNYSTRWLSYGALNIQPSEFFKLFYIIWLCAFLETNKKIIHKARVFIIPIMVFSMSAFILLLQPDFGSTAILFLITFIMLYVAKARILHLFTMLFCGVLGATILILVSSERLSRLNFLEPCSRYLEDGYHLCWSLMAIGSGGLFGKGLGASSTKLSYLSHPHTDFIFSILAEELGIFGIIFIIFLFYFFMKKCFFIGNKSFRVGLLFQGYLSYAIGIFIGSQAFLNMSVNLGIVPTKGLALPFFSYGGSNYLVSILSIAIILRIYRDVYKKSLNTSPR